MSRVAAMAAVLAAALLWVGARGLQARALEARESWPPDSQAVFLPDVAPVLRGLLGRELAADVLWARGLVYYGSARAETGTYRHLESFIDAIIEVDPYWKRTYRWAAYAVTFKGERATQKEYRTSIKYLEKGMEVFPDDYELFWLAGLRYFVDLYSEDAKERRRYRERGAELIEQAIHKPNAPPDLATLAAEMQSRLGQRQRAVTTLREMILTTNNEAAQKRMLRKLEGLTRDAELAREIEIEKERFVAEWKENLPLAPPGLYVILGPRPSRVIDLGKLAAPRELLGVGDATRSDPSHPPSSR